MLAILNYNFCSDGNALDPVPTHVQNITDTRLSNGIFDRWYATQNVSEPYPTTIPDQWDYDTIMDADFVDESLSAGNVDFTLDEVTSFRIKRRELGAFEWLTLVDIPITSVEDLGISFNDTLNKDGVTYEYAIVPVLNEIESNYITNSVLSNFDGIFICDLDTIYKFYAGVTYDSETQNHLVGTLTPMGRQFPIYVSNALTNYQTGSVTGTIMTPGFFHGEGYNSVELMQEKKELLAFLTNKRPKIIKDWWGQCWLVFLVGMPTVSYLEGSGLGLANVTFNWSEAGVADNQQDLYDTGMLEEL